MDFNAITKLTTPFADTGDAADILDTNTTGRAGWNNGFPTETQVDSPPFRIDFNGVLKRFSQACISFFAGKHYKFDSAFSTAVGGYPLGSILQRDDDIRLFLSIADNNTADPNSDLTDWLVIGDGGNADTLDGYHASSFAFTNNLPAVIGTFSNLTISTGGADYIINIDYDELVVKDGASARVLSNSVLVCDVSILGLGGIDVGAVAANTWYAIYVIFNPTTSVVSSLVSLSLTAPALPTGYTHFAQVGRIKADDTAQKYPLGILQHGKKVQPRVIFGSNTTNMPLLVGGVTGTFDWITPTYATVSLADIVPSNAVSVTGSIIGSTDPTGVLSSYVMVAPSNQYGGMQSTNPPPASNFLWMPASVWGSQVAVNLPFTFYLEAQSIAVVIAGSAGAVRILGWELS